MYRNLMSLVNTNETFFYKDFPLEDKIYRIFNYRLASYSDFLLPSALECRGIMYEIDTEGKAIRIACRPLKKFFNLYENPFTMDLVLNKDTVDNITVKEDGSLISTFIHNGELRLKSKMSLDSDQVIQATTWLNLPENKAFKEELFRITSYDATINLEWTSPENRIVLQYSKPELKILNARYNSDIIDIFEKSLSWDFNIPEINKMAVKNVNPDNIEQFISDIPEMKDIEGFVVLLKSGQRIKIKTADYLRKHKIKDSIDNDSSLIEAILFESIDDTKILFADNQYVLDRIKKFEDIIIPKYNHIESIVNTFYEENKHLDRKSYAIKGQKELDLFFSLAMNMYLQKPVDIKEFCMKHTKVLFLINY